MASWSRTKRSTKLSYTPKFGLEPYIMNYTLEDSLQAWEANAEFWDNFMGDNSNEFHRQTVRPKVSKLLDIQSGDFENRSA